MNTIPAPFEMLMEIYTGEYEGFPLNEVNKLRVSASQLYTASRRRLMRGCSGLRWRR